MYQHAALYPLFFLHAPPKDTMKLNSEKVELPPRPRPALSLVSTSPRVSELEDAASTREGDADEFSLVQLHHRLELECLPPVDQGKHAYLFLLACFILEALIWGQYPPIPFWMPPAPSRPYLEDYQTECLCRYPFLLDEPPQESLANRILFLVDTQAIRFALVSSQATMPGRPLLLAQQQ